MQLEQRRWNISWKSATYYWNNFDLNSALSFSFPIPSDSPTVSWSWRVKCSFRLNMINIHRKCDPEFWQRHRCEFWLLFLLTLPCAHLGYNEKSDGRLELEIYKEKEKKFFNFNFNFVIWSLTPESSLIFLESFPNNVEWRHWKSIRLQKLCSIELELLWEIFHNSQWNRLEGEKWWWFQQLAFSLGRSTMTRAII